MSLARAQRAARRFVAAGQMELCGRRKRRPDLGRAVLCESPYGGGRDRQRRLGARRVVGFRSTARRVAQLAGQCRSGLAGRRCRWLRRVFSVSSALTHWLNGRWGIYGEVYAWSDASILREASVEIGLGVTCAVGETGWVELACYVGVTRVAVDYTPALRCGWDF